MSQPLATPRDHARFLAEHPLAAVWFSGPDCAVCTALKPRVWELMARRFPAVALGEVDCAAAAGLAAQQSVFTIPTLVVYFEGREGLRKVRSFSLAGLEEELARPYGLLRGEA